MICFNILHFSYLLNHSFEAQGESSGIELENIHCLIRDIETMQSTMAEKDFVESLECKKLNLIIDTLAEHYILCATNIAITTEIIDFIIWLYELKREFPIKKELFEIRDSKFHNLYHKLNDNDKKVFGILNYFSGLKPTNLEEDAKITVMNIKIFENMFHENESLYSVIEILYNTCSFKIESEEKIFLESKIDLLNLLFYKRCLEENFDFYLPNEIDEMLTKVSDLEKKLKISFDIEIKEEDRNYYDHLTQIIKNRDILIAYLQKNTDELDTFFYGINDRSKKEIEEIRKKIMDCFSRIHIIKFIKIVDSIYNDYDFLIVLGQFYNVSVLIEDSLAAKENFFSLVNLFKMILSSKYENESSYKKSIEFLNAQLVFSVFNFLTNCTEFKQRYHLISNLKNVKMIFNELESCFSIFPLDTNKINDLISKLCVEVAKDKETEMKSFFDLLKKDLNTLTKYLIYDQITDEYSYYLFIARGFLLDKTLKIQATDEKLKKIRQEINNLFDKIYFEINQILLNYIYEKTKKNIALNLKYIIELLEYIKNNLNDKTKTQKVIDLFRKIQESTSILKRINLKIESGVHVNVTIRSNIRKKVEKEINNNLFYINQFKKLKNVNINKKKETEEKNKTKNNVLKYFFNWFTGLFFCRGYYFFCCLYI